MKSKFITFEGCEGSGKSTQLLLLKKYLDSQNIDYLFTREPGGTEISEKIRDILLDANNKQMSDECEALLYASARVEHVKNLILPSLEKNKLVICDRYIDSSFAYQAYARKLGFEYIKNINSFSIEKCMPSYTLFFNISPEDAFNRKGGIDKNDRLELSGLSFHQNVYLGYLKLCEIYPNRIIKLDVSGTKEQTHQKIINILKEKGVL